MKIDLNRSRQITRKLLVLFGCLTLIAGCGTTKNKTTKNEVVNNVSEDPLQKKFHGIEGVALMIDAKTVKENVSIMNEDGMSIFEPSIISLKSAYFSSYTGRDLHIPRTIRATWREGNVTRGRGYRFEGGTIIGDYTVPVAERIPDYILDYIRENGGALRLKIRLKDDGILIGWDIEKSLPIPGCKKGDAPICTALHNFLPGGDFREAQIYNGVITDPGW